MISTTAGKPLALSEPNETGRNKRQVAARKIWLPKLLYDCLPYFYLTSGFAAFFATLYISEWFWVLPHYLLFSAACIHFGIIVHRRRWKARDDISDSSLS